MAVTSAHDTVTERIVEALNSISFASNSTATEHNQPQRSSSATSSVTNRQIQIARDIQSEENTISRAASTENCRAMHFCLFARHERKSVAVNIGLRELEVRQRFGCPLGGRKVELRVLGRTERGRLEGNHIQIDCHNILSAHLTSTAGIPPSHDGRHLGLVTQALALRTDSLTTNFVRLILAASLADDEVFLTVLFCKHGRHRSVAVAMLYAILLTIFGAEVTSLSLRITVPLVLPGEFRSCVQGYYRAQIAPLPSTATEHALPRAENSLRLLSTAAEHASTEHCYRACVIEYFS